MALQRFDETRQIARQAQAQKLDPADIHINLYQMAFVENDSAAMAEEQKWFEGKSDYESSALSVASDIEVYGGRVGRGRELNKQAVNSAIRTDDKESAAIDLANFAFQQAVFGDAAKARKVAEDAIKLAPASPGVAVEQPLPFAAIGDSARSESLAQDLNKRYPLGTQMQLLWLPTIQAQLALEEKESGRRADRSCSLPPRSSWDWSRSPTTPPACFPSMFAAKPIWRAAKAEAAATEFQKVLDHSGIVGTCWTGALARLGLARAESLQARTSTAPTPMPLASGRSPPTKTSSRSGKTPTPTSSS